MLKTFLWSNILILIAPTIVFGIQARRFPDIALEAQMVAMTIFLAVNFFVAARSLFPNFGALVALLLVIGLSLPLAWLSIQNSLVAMAVWLAVLTMSIIGTRKMSQRNN